MLTKTSGWRVLARELVTIGADIHALSEAPSWPESEIFQTPFTSLFEGLQGFKSSRSISRLLQRLVTMWLEDLVTSGVDLVEYGRKEKEIWDLSSISKDVLFFMCMSSGFDHEAWHIHVIDVVFGAAPSDWHIWWSEPTDFLAGQFWAMIESPEELMPGSWIE